MSDNYGLVKWNTLHNIGEAIRNKTGSSDLFYPSEMANAINNISGGGGIDEPCLYSMIPYITNNGSETSKINLYNVEKFEFTNNRPLESILLDTDYAGSGSPCNINIYQRYENGNILLTEDARYLGITANYLYNNYMNDNIVLAETGTFITPELGDVVCSRGDYYFRWTNNLYNNGDYVNAWLNLGINIAQTQGPPYEESGNLYYNHHFYIYGFEYDNRFNNNTFSIVDMSYGMGGNFFYSLTGNYKGDAFCGNYTKYMRNAFYSCYFIKNAVSGPNVIDMSNAYCSCYNLIGSAACGDNVRNMFQAYTYCSNLTTAVVGNKVENLANAYQGCQNLIGDVVIPSTVTDISYSFSDCRNLNSITGDTSNVIRAEHGFGYLDNSDIFIDWDNFSWNNLVYGDSLFYNNLIINEINGFPKLQNAGSMFYNCIELKNISLETNKLINIASMCYDCYNLTQESYENILNAIDNDAPIVNGSYAFISCEGINSIHLKDCFRQSYSMYSGININMDNVTWDEGLQYLGQSFASQNINKAICPDSVISMVGAYSNCQYITEAVCGNNVINLSQTYYNCGNIINAVCGPNVANMDYAYNNCNNLINAECGDNVYTMNYAYYNCTKLQHGRIGNNVNTMKYAFWNCANLVDDIEINCPNLYVLGYVLWNCYNVHNILVAANNIYTSSSYDQYNAFGMSSIWGNSRNIVTLNRNVFNYLLNTSAVMCGSITSSLNTNQIVLSPSVNVTVNGIEYEAVRVATYNTTTSYDNPTYYNVYCTE